MFLDTRKSNFESRQCFFSYLVHYDTLLQNAADIITKCEISFITKCDNSLSQNASDFLLHNAIVLLQIATVMIKCVHFITKCDTYYKLQRLLQNASVQ